LVLVTIGVGKVTVDVGRGGVISRGGGGGAIGSGTIEDMVVVVVGV
jgi:hypothetical protein